MTTLTERLDLAVAAGVPTSELEGVGFKYSTLGDEEAWLWFGRTVRSLKEDPWRTSGATAAFERVAIGWMVRVPTFVHIETVPDGVSLLAEFGGGKRSEIRAVAPTLSAAIEAALRAIGGGD